MTKTVDSAFVTQWNKEAHISFEEQESALWKYIKKVPAQSAKVHSFTVFANLDAQDDGKTQGSDLVREVASTSNVTATMKVPYIQVAIDDWDAAMTSVNYRESVNQMAMNALVQKIDDQLITALAGTTETETTLPTVNTLNFAGAQKMAEALTSKNVPYNDRMAVVSPGAMTDLMTDSTYINNFHFQNDVVANGIAKGVAGIDLIQSNRLGNGAAGSTERRCYFFQKEAFQVALNRDVQISVDWDPRLQGWLYTASVIFGSAVVDPLGVQFCDVTN